mmetsp:Transcript_18244/g.21815  ORF Transcript_18244/g.21815 Transcript_18244/m.21815 type:complete len:84 (+) Transcript_18244:368-619(+)
MYGQLRRSDLRKVQRCPDTRFLFLEEQRMDQMMKYVRFITYIFVSRKKWYLSTVEKKCYLHLCLSDEEAASKPKVVFCMNVTH